MCAIVILVRYNYTYSLSSKQLTILLTPRGDLVMWTNKYVCLNGESAFSLLSMTQDFVSVSTILTHGALRGTADGEHSETFSHISTATGKGLGGGL